MAEFGELADQGANFMDADLEKNEIVELTAEIVSAYVSNNTVVAAMPNIS